MIYDIRLINETKQKIISFQWICDDSKTLSLNLEAYIIHSRDKLRIEMVKEYEPILVERTVLTDHDEKKKRGRPIGSKNKNGTRQKYESLLTNKSPQN